MWINGEEQLGSETDYTTWGSSTWNKASKPLAVKTCGSYMAGETASLIAESTIGSHRVLEHAQAHPPRNQCQGSARKDATHLWEVGEVTESGARAEQMALFPL